MVPPFNPSNEDGTYTMQDLAPHVELKNIKTSKGLITGRFSLIPIGRFAVTTGIRHAYVQEMINLSELSSLTMDKTTFVIVDADRWSIR
ncbi:MAG: hypothetical protein RL228_369 [Actinomycetota bacterium]|jgi:hypothetical protein